MVTSSKVMRHLSLAEEMRQLWASQTPTGVTPPAVGYPMAAGALSMIGINEVIVYGAEYSTRTAAAGTTTRTLTRFLNDRRILLLPAEPLGYMWTAPAEPNDWNTGKFAWTERRQDPWVIEVGAGLYAFPDMQNNANKILEATVLAA